MRRSRLFATGTALLLALTLAACGSDDDATDNGANSTATASNDVTEPDTDSDAVDCSEDVTGAPDATSEFGSAPEIAVPSGPPPCELIVTDLTEGSGEPVEDLDQQYLWNYEGIAWSTGEVFDSSFQRGAPISFALNQVISGWTEGLQGIEAGGRRILVIPPDQAYGAAGSPPAIGPNETLVFVVDLVEAA